MESTRLHGVLLAAILVVLPAQQTFGQQDANPNARPAQANVAVDLTALAADDEAVPPAATTDHAATTAADVPLLDLTTPVTADAADVEPASPTDEQTAAHSPTEPHVATTTADDAAPAATSPTAIPRGGAGAAAQETTNVAIPHAGQPDRSAGTPWYRGPYVALGVVLALIAALTLLFRRFVPTSRPLAADALRVIGRAPISAKQTAVLLHVGRRIVLVGVSADGMRTLAEIADPEEVAFLLGKTNAQPAGAPTFDSALAREFDQYAAPDDVPADPETTPDETLVETKGQLQGLLTRLRALQSA